MKDNKLLAEYLRLKTISNNMYFHGEWVWNHDGTELTKYNPDSDWNQLMMVVYKIKKELDSKKLYCESLQLGLIDANIRKVYNACVGYIKSK